MDERAEISTHLRQLADMLEHPTAIHVATRARLAERLRELADHNLVELPAIDPGRDDLGHWHRLEDQRLRSENYADAWNLAAGLHVAHMRDCVNSMLRALDSPRDAS